MPGPLLLAAIGAGLGGVKSIGDAKRRSRAQDLQAMTARYSPWTGINPTSIDVPQVNTIGNIMQGGVSGAMLGKNISAAETPKSSWFGVGGDAVLGKVNQDPGIVMPGSDRARQFSLFGARPSRGFAFGMEKLQTPSWLE